MNTKQFVPYCLGASTFGGFLNGYYHNSIFAMVCFAALFGAGMVLYGIKHDED